MISGTLLTEKSLHIATVLGIEDFKASNGWIDSFKQQRGVVYKPVPGECKDVDFWSAEEWQKVQLLKINEGYEPKDIYNTDEMGMSFRLPPNKMLSLKGESLQWWKELQAQDIGSVNLQSKDTDKLPLLVTANKWKSQL